MRRKNKEMDCRKRARVLEDLRCKRRDRICENRKYQDSTTNGGISSQMWSKAFNSRRSTEARHEENRRTVDNQGSHQIEMLKKRKRSWEIGRSGVRTAGRYTLNRERDKDQVVWLKLEAPRYEWKAMKPERNIFYYIRTTL